VSSSGDLKLPSLNPTRSLNSVAPIKRFTTACWRLCTQMI